jgi:FdhE protein
LFYIDKHNNNLIFTLKELFSTSNLTAHSITKETISVACFFPLGKLADRGFEQSKHLPNSAKEIGGIISFNLFFIVKTFIYGENMRVCAADLKTIEQHLDNLKGKQFISDDTVEFFRAIFRAQQKTKTSLAGSSFPALTEGQSRRQLEAGQPVFSFQGFSADRGLLRSLFLELCGIMNKQDTASHSDIQRLLEAEKNGVIDLATLIAKLPEQDNDYFQALSESTGVSTGVLLFCAFHCAKPFYESAAEKLQLPAEEEDLWMRRQCPVCGSAAQLSKLEKEDGKRQLYCLLCGTEWRFMRLQCAFCNSAQTGGMKFIAEEDGPWRIDVCDQCRGYLKTLDEKKASGTTSGFIPAVADVATLYLDLFAEKEGYKKLFFLPPEAAGKTTVDAAETIH